MNHTRRLARNLNNQKALERYGFVLDGGAYSLPVLGGAVVIGLRPTAGKTWQAYVRGAGRKDWIGESYSESTPVCAHAINAIKAAVKLINNSPQRGFDCNTGDTNTEHIMSKTQEQQTTAQKLDIKPGRYYVLRIRKHDNQIAGRWMSELTESAREQMKEDPHVAFDFDLPAGEDIIGSTMDLQQTARFHNEVHNATKLTFAELIVARRKEYRDYFKKDGGKQ